MEIVFLVQWAGMA